MGETPTEREDVRPPVSTGRLETDTFCAACGYNLHGQNVWPDDRLGIVICRCPECGKHHPAGFGTSARAVWLNRLGTMALVIWIVIVLAILGLLTFSLGGMQGVYVGNSTVDVLVTKGGRLVEYGPIGTSANYGYVDKKTQQPVGNDFHNRLILRDDPSDAAEAKAARRQFITLLVVSFMIGSLVGGLLTTAMWHWPRWTYLVGCALPLLAWGVLTTLSFSEEEYEVIQSWAIGHALLIAALECAGVLAGVRFGRPFARTVARLVVPPKPRMLLAFLWHADGLKIPTSQDPV